MNEQATITRLTRELRETEAKLKRLQADFRKVVFERSELTRKCQDADDRVRELNRGLELAQQLLNRRKPERRISLDDAELNKAVRRYTHAGFE